MTERPPPREEPQDGAYRLSPREGETSNELRHLDPQLAYFYEQGLSLLGRLDEPGAASNLSYFGRELSRGVLQRVLDEEGISFEDLDHVPEAEGNLATVAAALRLPPDDPRVDTWFRLPGAFAGWEKYRPGGPPPDDVRRAFETLSDLLFGLVAPYYVTENELDALLALEDPSHEDAQRLHGLQLRPVQRSYFFGRVENPKWIEPLVQAGFFRNPPDRKVNADGSWSARPWPEGEYLMRVAPNAPESVAAVLGSFPDTNENPVVWDILARAAARLSADLAAPLIPKLTRGLCSPGARLFSESVVELAARLADAGRVEAFDLVDYLLFVESPAALHGRADRGVRLNTERLFPRFGWHDQQALLEKLLPALEDLDAERALRLLFSKLERVQALADDLELTARWLVWGLDFRARSGRDEIVSSIIGEASDMAERIADRGREEAERVMAIIEGCSGDVFKRLGHRVLAAAGENLKDRLDRLIGSDECVHAGHPAREIALVLRKQFRNASPAARETFSDAVIEGPDRAEVRGSLRRRGGEPPTEEEVEEFVAHWQRRRLTWFRGDIPEELSDLAEALKIFGKKPSYREQELAEVGMYTEAGSWGGVEPTPITPEELAALSPAEVVDFLAEWEPGLGPGSAEGLHASLSRFAREHPASALAVLELGPALEPLRLESVLRGLLDAARARSELDWSGVLHSVQEMAAHAGAVEDLGAPRHPAWRGALSVGLEIIREGCGSDAMPPETFPTLWPVLRDAMDVKLVWDLTERERPENFEAISLGAFNDASGHLVRAVVSAALRNYRARLSSGENTPEIRERARAPVRNTLVPLLDRVLAEEGPNSAFAQAVLGEFVPQLQLLAPEWVQENEDLLFAGGVDDPVSRPAWTAYISGARLYDSVFVQLRPWYLKAAERVREWNEAAGDPGGVRSVAEKLAVHLIVAVLRGLVTPEDEDGLLPTAFESMDASDWGHAYWVVFRSWSDADAPPPSVRVERLVRLWEWRISELETTAQSEASVEEAKTLGWLFHTPHIPDADVIRLGKATVRLAKGHLKMYSRWDHMLELAKSDPDGTFEIVDFVLLAELRSEFPHVPSDVRPFLEYVLKAGGKESRQRARRLVHKLGERGFREFRDLLEEDNVESIGILAFGSLRNNPGSEIDAALVERRTIETPFRVEFARYSNRRGGAPTLVPVEEGGATLAAEILVLRQGTSPQEARSILWRRETHRMGSGEHYERPEKPGPNHVLVEELRGFAGIDMVLYTDFPPSGKELDANPEALARRAVESVRNAQAGKDGITYLIKARAAGTVTPKTEAYEGEILRHTRAATLEEALVKASGEDTAV